ncbi:MAG TPA: trypsin-like serine protease [Bryobacteraceae bacterium]|nr:trypsin-like serine protease [Bryobacteraceae bacterium]
MHRISEVLVLAACLASSGFGITTFLATDSPDYASTYSASAPQYDGVAKLIVNIPGVGGEGCTGSLLSSGQEILTAAHCVTHSGTFVSGTTVSVTFDSGTTIETGDITVNPTYNNTNETGDLAVIHLGQQAPLAIPRYGLYTGLDEQFQVLDIVGYGETGSGITGADGSATFGTKYRGENRVEGFIGDFNTFESAVLADTDPWVSDGSTLLFDFDGGTVDSVNTDVAGYSPFNQTDPGLGNEEIDIAPGDSGGPEFIGGLIAGVSVLGTRFPGKGDIDNQIDSTFGELGGAMRVSSYSDWILANEVPEPSTLILVGCGFMILAWRKRRASRA